MSPALRITSVAALVAGVSLVAWVLCGGPDVGPADARVAPSGAAPFTSDGVVVPGAERTAPQDDVHVATAEVHELEPGTYPLDTTPPAHATVLVVDAAGRPVPGATVWFHGEGLPPEVRLPGSDDGADDPLRWLQAHGATVISDASGRATVPRTTTEVRVVAAKDGAVGMLAFGMSEPAPPGGFRVVLAPSRRLRIELVDAAGAAVPRAPLGIHLVAPTPDVEPRAHAIGWTNDAGVLDVVADDDLLAAAARGTVVVRWPRTRLAASRYDADAGTLRLALPAGGSVEVAYVDLGGRPIAGHHFAEWYATGGSAGTHAGWCRTDADGCMRLPHVPAELSFRVAIGEDHVEFAGPRRPGDAVRATVGTGARTIVVRGRALAGGQPVPSTPLLVELGPMPAPDEQGNRAALWPALALASFGRAVSTSEHGPPSPPHRDYQRPGTVTAADGTFAFTVRRAHGELGGVVWLLPAPRSPDCRHAEIVVPADAPGTIELGDVALHDDGLVLSGRIVDESGRPITHAQVEGTLGGIRPEDLRQGAFVAADGTFRVYRNRPSAQRVQLWAHAVGCTPSGGLFAPGGHDVQIVLRRQALLRVEVLVDADVLPLAAQTHGALRRDGEQLTFARTTRAGDRWVVELAANAGDVEFVLQLRDAEERLAAAVLPARAGNVHLHRIDLRERLAVHVVDARDEAGKPVHPSCVVFEPGEPGEPRRCAVDTMADGVVRVLATRPTSDLLLTASDREPLRVAASLTPSRVVMRRLPTLTLHWAGESDEPRPKLEWRVADGDWRDAMAGPFVAPAFCLLSLRAVVARADGSTFVLPLDPLPVTPGMDPAVGVSLTPDQSAALRAAAGG